MRLARLTNIDPELGDVGLGAAAVGIRVPSAVQLALEQAEVKGGVLSAANGHDRAVEVLDAVGRGHGVRLAARGAPADATISGGDEDPGDPKGGVEVRAEERPTWGGGGRDVGQTREGQNRRRRVNRTRRSVNERNALSVGC